MKVFVSFDMEGVAGIVDWSQCLPPGQPYEEGRGLLLGEVNAAIDGALAAGATEIVCNDSHGAMNNLDPELLHGQATYVSGRHKPLYMMQGLEAGADVVFMVGYHGSISGESSILSHTYNPSVVSHVTLNGVRVGESGINALVALACGVPIGLITGDRQTAAEADPFLAGAERVVVKESFTRFGAVNQHPEVARARIAEAARRVVERVASLRPPAITLPAALEVHLQTADMAEVASWVRGAERTGVRTVTIGGQGCAIWLAIVFGPILYFSAAIWLGTHGMALLAEEMVGLVVAAGLAGGLVALARRAASPRFAEFDGQVIRQWMVKGGDESPDEYHVAIDDGTREQAWDFSIGSEPYRRLPPGTFVHVRVNLRRRADVTVEPVEPPAVAHPLARVAADQERAVTNGLPDPADLVLEAEAAAILGGKVRGHHLDGAPGRTMVWQPPSTGRPMLRVEVRHAADARRVPPTARAAPGVADGYFVSQGAAVTVSALTALISIHGSVHIAAEASLAGLLPVVEGRLRELARRIDFNQY